MTYLELVERLYSETGLAGQAPTAVTGQSGMKAKLLNWIGDAWLEVQTARAWPFNGVSYQKLAANTDVPTMPEEFHMMIVWRALASYAESEEAPAFYAKAMRNHNILYTRLHNKYYPLGVRNEAIA
jgi:hypothetical protein